MSFLSKKIKETKRTQVIATNLALDELIKDDVLKELKEKFSEDGEIITTYIRFHLIPKKEISDKEVEGAKKKGIVITTIDSATLEHPSPTHIKGKVVVITANKSKILEKFLK